MPVNNGNLLEEPFIIAHFVYNNNRKRLHTPRRQRCEPFIIAHFVYNNNESSAQHAHCQWEPFGGVCTHRRHNDSSAQHAHCQCVYCSWECFGGVYCSLGMFGNVWECFGGIYCSLGMFGNVLEESIVLWEYLLFEAGGPCNLYLT